MAWFVDVFLVCFMTWFVDVFWYVLLIFFCMFYGMVC